MEEQLEDEDEVHDDHDDQDSSASVSVASKESKPLRKKPVVHAVTPEPQPPKSPDSSKPVNRKKPLDVDSRVYGAKKARVLDDDDE